MSQEVTEIQRGKRLKYLTNWKWKENGCFSVLSVVVQCLVQRKPSAAFNSLEAEKTLAASHTLRPPSHRQKQLGSCFLEQKDIPGQIQREANQGGSSSGLSGRLSEGKSPQLSILDSFNIFPMYPPPLLAFYKETGPDWAWTV